MKRGKIQDLGNGQYNEMVPLGNLSPGWKVIASTGEEMK